MLGAALPFAAPHIAQAMKNPNGALRTAKHAAGRLVGLSGADLGALEANGGTVTGLPGWLWGVVGITAGALAATYFATKRPDLVPNCLRGDRLVMFFQPSPILPQASGLGFAFDHVPWVRQMQRHGTYPWLTGAQGAMIHSGVRRRNASTGRMGGQRRTSWLVGLSGDVEGNVSVTPVVDPKVGPPTTVSTEDAADAVAGAATGGFIAGGVVAALPAAALGLLLGYMIWGGKG